MSWRFPGIDYAFGRWIAIGYACKDQRCTDAPVRAAIWISTDGLSWETVSVETSTAFSRLVDLHLDDVTSGWAVGTTGPRGSRQGAVWQIADN